MVASGLSAEWKATAQETLFLVWGPPSHGPRSRVLARELGISALHYVFSTTRRGALVAPVKYGFQALKTIQILVRERPRLVFVQSPPSPAVLLVWLYCALFGARFVVDAHSDALLRPIWTWPRFVHRFLWRRAITVIVTNDELAGRVRRGGGHAFVLRDVPTRFPAAPSFAVSERFNVVFVHTGAPDEPLAEVIAAARQLPGVQVYVTGKRARIAPELRAALPPNVVLTDFLPDEQFYALLHAADAVMCLTTRDNTMQRGACEALSLGRPIITSDWPILRSYFHQGTVHVFNKGAAIAAGIEQMRAQHRRYADEIVALQHEQRAEWLQKAAALSARIAGRDHEAALKNDQSGKARHDLAADAAFRIRQEEQS